MKVEMKEYPFGTIWYIESKHFHVREIFLNKKGRDMLTLLALRSDPKVVEHEISEPV